MGINDRIDIMTNNETSVTSEKINKPKKAVAKKKRGAIVYAYK